jgi:hypothetical protein
MKEHRHRLPGNTTSFTVPRKTRVGPANEHQERRVSARRGWAKSQPHTRPLFVGRPPTVCADCRCIRVSRRHGGLTPPALGGSAVRRFAGKTATCGMHERWFTRAAGVSPPWERNALAMARIFFRKEYIRAPRLAYASRSSCTVPVDRKITTFAVHKRTFCTSGGRHPTVQTVRDW